MVAPKGRRPVAVVYSPKEYQAWQQEAGKLLREVVAERFDGPVQVYLDFAVRRPKTTKLTHPKPDIDNYAKAVLDAITKDGRFWSDDTQVVALAAAKRWAGLGDPVGIRVTIMTA